MGDRMQKLKRYIILLNCVVDDEMSTNVHRSAAK